VHISVFWLTFTLCSFMATGWFFGYTMAVRLHNRLVVATWNRYRTDHQSQL
jgi:hypothetical protein